MLAGMQRKSRTAFFPCFVVFSAVLLAALSAYPAAAEAPAEAKGFSGGGLHLYPLGWSSEGRWGALIGRNEGADTSQVTILVIDAVTDEVLHRSEPLTWSGPDSFGAFWNRYSAKVKEVTASFNLELGLRPDVRDARFTTGGYNYEFVMNPPSPASGRYSLSLKSSRGDMKDVFQSPVEKAPRRSYLLGSLVSPFEARALAVIREEPSYGEGLPEYRFSGAHLSLGFISMRTDDSVGSLISAVMNGQEYLVKSRLAAGADPEEADARNYTALLLAARLGHWSMLGDLLAAGASPNPRDAEGRTPLHYAAFRGNPIAVKALLDAGADKSLRDRAGRTPAELAADSQVREMLR